MRSPIITILGHIDHGKSSLLDYIRKSKIIESEAGSITQQTNAYQINHQGTKMTFIDTPGHSAFNNMRDTGSLIADIVLLIVSSEDGVKEQTKESIKTIQENNLPYIVVFTKIDLPNSNVENAKMSVLENGILLEKMGGDIPYAEISNKTGSGVGELLNLIKLQAEILELKEDEKIGYVLESQVNKNTGISCVIIPLNSKINEAKFVVSDGNISPTRIITDTENNKVTHIEASQPVIISGFNGIPQPGSSVEIFDNKKTAEKFISENQKSVIKDKIKKDSIPIVVKGDTFGVASSVKEEILKNLQNVEIIDTSIGDIAESDLISLKGNKKAIIVGMNVGVDKKITNTVNSFEGNINTFNVIYELIDWVKNTADEITDDFEHKNSFCEIIKLFNQENNKRVVGVKVVSGVIKKGAKIDILRGEDDILYDSGNIIEIQADKEKLNSIKKGDEAAIQIKSDKQLDVKDILKVRE